MSVVVSVVTLAVFVFAVGRACSRLLGVRLGGWRSAVVGVLGWFIGALATLLVFSADDPGVPDLQLDTFAERAAALGTLTFFGVLAAMPVAIALDLLTRRSGAPHHRSWRDRLHPVRAVRRRLAPYQRLHEVAAIARRENLLHVRYASSAAFETEDFAIRLRTVLEESGGMLVKFGQIASTRTDSLPEPLTKELANLQSDVHPITAEAVRSVIESELGEPVERAFATFDFQSLAAASIGQTHRATLASGERVVVKVQRPGIADVVGRDAAMLRLAAAQLERRVDAARAVGLGALCEELIVGVQQELDYRHEASAGMRLRERRADDEGISIPRVFPTLSTSRILVMEEVVGRSIADASALDASPVARPELARRLLLSFFGQVLEDGIFHADPHPGNLFVDADGCLWLIDFGSVGRLDPLTMDGLRAIAIGVATREPSLLARAVRDLGRGDGTTDLHALETDLAVQINDLEGAGGLDPRMITGVLGVMQRHDLHPPPSITLLGRALLTLDGTAHIIDPGIDIAAQSSAIVSGGEVDVMGGTPAEVLEREALRALPALRTLPDHVEALANQLRSGTLSVRTERYAAGDRAVVDGWVDRVVVAIVGAFGVLASAVLLLAGAVAEPGPIRTTLILFGMAGLSFATVLLMRSAARALRRLPVRID